MFNVLEFAGGFAVTLLIVFAVTQVIVPELFGWPKYWLFDAKKRAKIEGTEHPPVEPAKIAPKYQPKLNNKNNR